MSDEPTAVSSPLKGKYVTAFLNFLFLKVHSDWRRLPTGDRRQGIEEFISTIKKHGESIEVRSYSTLGLREDADFMLWLIAEDVRKMQELVGDIYKTGFGKYLEITHSYVSTTRTSPYTKAHIQAFQLDLEPTDYLIVYPFVKSREWYLLPFEERKRMMEEHMAVGRSFPSVRINTTYSFGLDDQDFVLAFETDSLEQFQELVMKLRETQVSRYTVRDTPMMVCVRKSLEDSLRSFAA